MHGPAANFYSMSDMAYYSPQHFSASFASANTLTLAGLAFAPSSNQFMEVRVSTVGGATLIFPGSSYSFSYVSATGVLTINGVSPFLVTDTAYRVVVLGEAKAYSAAGNYLNQSEVAPLNTAAVLSETLLDATNPATQDLPSSSGLQMLGYQHLALNGVLITANTISIQVFGSSDPDVVPANMAWVALYGYSHGINAYTNIISCTNTTVTYAWDFDYLNHTYVKVVFTNGAAANNTTSVFVRRSY